MDGKADATDTKEKKSGAAESIAVGGTVALSILMAVAIFIVLPYFLSMLFSHYVLNESLLAIVEGVLRIVIFVAYVAGISAMKDIRRVYMYHGAEHKCINCTEQRQRADGEKCPQKLQTAQALRNELFVVCHAGEHRTVFVYPGTEPAVETWIADSFDSCDRRDFL